MMVVHSNSKPFTPEEFKAIYSKVPRVTVDLIIKTPEGLLLTLRAHESWKGRWHFPGGTVLYKETVAETIARVAQVEVGVSVEVVKPLGYIEYPSEEQERGFGTTVALAFLCKSFQTTFTVNEDASEARAFKVPPENFIHEHAAFLQKHWDEYTALKV